TLLDAMERRTEDPEELADLFRLDHLTTRMRRHAEGLVILSGAAPSRQWRKPVPLVDVVRAAVAEVEDYERVEVRQLPPLAVDGAAVADLTHLIAELLENATVFSPPHTGVQVLGGRVPSGFTLEIHDRGLGMAPEALLEANLRLAETPEFQLSDTDRLGLFVVSRLARRQDVRVSLQPSPYGGITAVVLIPGALLTESAGTGDRDAGTSGRNGIGAGGGERAGAPARTSAGLPRRGARPAPGAVRDGPVERESPVEVPGFPADQYDQHQHADEGTGLPYGHGPARSGGTGSRPRTPGTAGGLPRRVPQASLVRPPGSGVPGGHRDRGRSGNDGNDGNRAPARDRAHGQDRAADEARDRMASLQRGWQRGRWRETDSARGTGTAGPKGGDGPGDAASDAGPDAASDQAPGTLHRRGTADERTERHGRGHHPEGG
ncbi:MAG TPA: ATP-binding protein, partial [Streptomyces sp.]|nr:ATP-binding protein [Streptomyces sp.]